MGLKKRFISILSDFGFKRIFGNQTDTRFLRKVLQILIQSDVPIIEVQFDNTVHQGSSQTKRGGIVDVSCIDEKERVFVVEMQRRQLGLFIHRTKFYAFKHLDMMVKKGKYKFDDLNSIYLISFLDGKAYDTDEFHQMGCIRNQHGELMDDQITYVVVELGKWDKTEDEVESDLDKLMLLMKYTETATIDQPIPKILTDTDWMEHTIQLLKEENLTDEERLAYEMELARVGFLIGADERDERKRQETEQKARETEQKARETEQKAKETEQKAKETEQKAKETEQKISAAITNLIKEGSFSDEKIANLLNVGIEKVHEIKQDLKK